MVLPRRERWEGEEESSHKRRGPEEKLLNENACPLPKDRDGRSNGENNGFSVVKIAPARSLGLSTLAHLTGTISLFFSRPTDVYARETGAKS